jgi:hypothetical protein
MKECPICNLKFDWIERLFRVDDKHFVGCEEKERTIIREAYAKTLREQRMYQTLPRYPNLPYRRITPQPDYSEPNFPVSSNDNSSDFLTGVVVGGVAGAVVSNWLDSPSEPKFEGSGGTFGGGGAAGSWEDDTNTIESHNATDRSDDSNTSSCDTSSDSGSCSSD